jgi:rRNA-processing protein FCF1
MKKLFESLKHVDSGNFVLLDTCFIFDLLEKNYDLLEGFNYAVTSFTAEELVRISHKLSKDKVKLRELVKKHSIAVLDVPVHLGEWESEKEYVKSIDGEILKYVADASDAVLLAAAVKTHSIVLTKDKHHLFTVVLENFLEKYGLKVYKELKDLKLQQL